MVQNKFNLKHFPEHIQINILQNLSSNDLKSFLLVNSSYYELITRNSCLNRKFILNLNQKSLSDSALKNAIFRTRRVFANVTLNWSTIYTEENWDETSRGKDIIGIFRHFGVNVHKFVMLGDFCFSLNFVRKILEQTPNMEHLELRVIGSNEKIESVILYKLKYFAISSTSNHLEIIGNLLDKIDTIECFKSSGSNMFTKILMNQSKLRELHLSNFIISETCNEFRAKFWIEFFAKNQNIRILKLKKVGGLTNEIIEIIIRNLKESEITNCIKM